MRPLAVPLILVSWANSALADPLPVFLDSHEYERRLPSANVPLDAYLPAALPLQRTLAAGQPTALPSDQRLVLHKVRFEGGTVYPLSELREHYQPLIGRTITVAELQQFTDRLTQRYRHDGFPLSYAYLPQQDLADGRAQVELVEGYVHDYQLQGDIGAAAAYFMQLMERLKAERPLTDAALQRTLGLMQRVPGITVQAEMAAAEGADGAARLTLRASRKPFAAAVTVNDGSRDDAQALLTVSSNAQTQLAEQLTARFLLPPGDDRAHYQRLDYSQYLDAQGSQLLLSVARYRSEPGTRVRLDDGSDFTQRIESERYAMGFAQPLIIAPNESMSVAGHFYSVSEHIDDRRGGQREYDTYVRALSFEGNWRKAEPQRLRMVSAGVYQGLDYLDARSDARYDMDFLRFRLAALQGDNWFDNWQGVASGALYWSDDRLPDSERAVFGGQQFGHGYPRDQAAGDKGWGAAYELNYSIRPGTGWLRLLQPYALLDAAQAWYNGGPIADARMSSLALGVRLSDGHDADVSLELAKPLADEALDSMSRAPRLMMSLTYRVD
ncbi:ShlB/FhaC/HecB family hemolysin secretion/activation protein [Pseudomonas sp. KU43P]|uniref:ShlB/FhaC/HecB family hemolysin secretion/activation protein n=1 Tax=Pseudomonas sp. KU43P TaxID=2487887 RepID=UPI0012A78D48|nr:POTRA domain-containing protein [Pseudomonas sp. KU43P]BBH44137.1 hypothetical protein KU43P_06140 [Pseudomonas sp. KU43P]